MESLIIIESILILVVLIRNIYLNKKMNRDVKLYDRYINTMVEEHKKVQKQNKELTSKLEEERNKVNELTSKLEEEKNKVNELTIKLDEEKDKTKKSKTKNDNKIKKLSDNYEELLKKYNLLNSVAETNNKEQEEKQEGKLEEEAKKTTKRTRKTKKNKEENING